MKTPALQEPLKPLKRLEIAAAEEHKQAEVEYRVRDLIGRQQRKIAEGDVSDLGDTSTLADPTVVESLVDGRK